MFGIHFRLTVRDRQHLTLLVPRKKKTPYANSKLSVHKKKRFLFFELKRG